MKITIFVLYAIVMLALGMSEIVYMGTKCDRKIKTVRGAELLVFFMLSMMIITKNNKLSLKAISGCYMILAIFFVKELGFWWLSIRKYLFFNKVVNPFNTDYLITFDFKNEVLKYFGTLREMDKNRFTKWAFYLVATPIALLAYACSMLLYTLLLVLSNTPIIHTVLYRTQVYLTVFCFCTWYTGYNAAKKFYRKSTKKK